MLASKPTHLLTNNVTTIRLAVGGDKDLPALSGPTVLDNSVHGLFVLFPPAAVGRVVVAKVGHGAARCKKNGSSRWVHLGAVAFGLKLRLGRSEIVDIDVAAVATS